jgi:hypothetical protein
MLFGARVNRIHSFRPFLDILTFELKYDSQFGIKLKFKCIFMNPLFALFRKHKKFHVGA